jgi:hypothetical protein
MSRICSSFLLLATISLTPSASAQCQWQLGAAYQDSPLVGDISATTTWDPDGAGPLPAMLVVGGSNITIAGQSVTSNIAAFDGTRWTPLGAGISGSIFALASFNGELVAAGIITSAGGLPVSNIARWNGTSWNSLGIGVNNTVLALSVFNSSLYASGAFTTAGGAPTSHIARWDGSSWNPLGAGVNGTAQAMTVLSGALYVGGSFSTAGSFAVNNLARWTGSTWQTVGSGTGGPIYTLGGRQTASNARLYVGGQFTSAGGVSVNNVVAVDSVDAIPSYAALGAGLSPYVNKVVVRAIGASNTEVTAVTPPDGSGHAIWRLSGTAWNSLGAIPVALAPIIAADDLIFYNGQYVTGLEHDHTADVRYWDTTTSLWAPLGPGIHGTINAAVPFGTDLIVGGAFDYASGVFLNNIGRWNGTTWTPMAGGMFGTVYALLVYQGDLYAAGDFTATGSGAASGIARWTGSAWTSVGPPLGISGPVFAMTEYNGQLLIGGSMSSGADVMAWDGSSWHPMANGLSSSAYPNAFGLAPDGTLYLGGFGVINSGSYQLGLARYNPATSTWAEVLGLADDSTVFAFGRSANTLYAGGIHLSYATVSGQTRQYELASITPSFATVDQSVYSIQPQFSVSDGIRSFAAYNGSLYAAGNFDHTPAANTGGLLRLESGVWTPVGNGAASSNFGNAAALYQNELVIAGDMAAGALSGHGLARWFCPAACYANCDQSTQAPVLNVADFTCFLQKFAATDPYANCDGSTQPPVLNVADFTCFLQSFAAGCP